MKLNGELVDHQARAVLAALDGITIRVPDTVWVERFVLYNGREKWDGLTVSLGFSRQTLFIEFGENRNSDELCVQHWFAARHLNPPTQADVPEDSYYNNRQRFGNLEVRKAVEHIVKLIEEYTMHEGKEK
jgi:hypothetical protein